MTELVRRKERLAGLFLLALTIINAASILSLASQLRRGYQDFTIFYCSGLMLRGGEVSRLYDLQRQYQVQLQFAPYVDIRQVALPYNHPPFEALLFWPLAYLSFFPAYLVWNLLNAIMLTVGVAIVKRTFKEVSDLHNWFLFLAVCAFPPIAIALMQGQDSVVLMFFATAGLILLERKRDAAAGVALAVCLFKLQIALPLTLILALRRPRLLAGFAPAAAALTVISVTMVGWNGMVQYVDYVLKLEKTGAGGAIQASSMPNLHGLIASTLGQGKGPFVTWSTIAASVVAVGLAAWLVRSRNASVRFLFAVASITAILVSYHAIWHDLSLLVPVVLLLFAAPSTEQTQEVRSDATLLILLYAILWISTYWTRLSPIWALPALLWLFRKRDVLRMNEAIA